MSKTLSGARNPSKTPTDHRAHLYRYDMFKCFANRVTSKSKHSESDAKDHNKIIYEVDSDASSTKSQHSQYVFSTLITKKDMDVLEPGVFLNDSVIDFYIVYLISETKAEPHRFCYLNTYFFQALDSVRNQLPKSKDDLGIDVFQWARKWTKEVNIFEKEYVFVPVNTSKHWSLIIICHPGEVATMDVSSKGPCILHLDSCIGMHTGLEKLIRSFLWHEWKAKMGEHDHRILMNILHLDFSVPQVPQQPNGYDCGLFVLHYAELFMKLASNCTTNYTDFRNQLNQKWFLTSEVTKSKRAHIKEVLHKFFEAEPSTPDAS